VNALGGSALSVLPGLIRQNSQAAQTAAAPSKMISPAMNSAFFPMVDPRSCGGAGACSDLVPCGLRCAL
jgi:hypothetical protein